VLYNFVNQRISTVKESSREAYYYIPLHMALALLKGTVDSHMYTDENFSDPAIGKIMEKVQVLTDPELDVEAAATKAVTAVIVEITTNDGKIHSKKLSHWRGDPENPPTKEEIQDKFRKISAKTIQPEQAEQLIDLIDHLETVKDLNSIGNLIRWS
jgi:2-methylcitrate dehydratase PrpD